VVWNVKKDTFVGSADFSLLPYCSLFWRHRHVNGSIIGILVGAGSRTLIQPYAFTRLWGGEVNMGARIFLIKNRTTNKFESVGTSNKKEGSCSFFFHTCTEQKREHKANKNSTGKM
jgi:hypothetical protein